MVFNRESDALIWVSDFLFLYNAGIFKLYEEFNDLNIGINT